MKVCSTCHETIQKEGAKFCPHCGAAQESVTVKQPAETTNHQPVYSSPTPQATKAAEPVRQDEEVPSVEDMFRNSNYVQFLQKNCRQPDLKDTGNHYLGLINLLILAIIPPVVLLKSTLLGISTFMMSLAGDWAPDLATVKGALARIDGTPLIPVSVAFVVAQVLIAYAGSVWVARRKLSLLGCINQLAAPLSIFVVGQLGALVFVLLEIAPALTAFVVIATLVAMAQTSLGIIWENTKQMKNQVYVMFGAFLIQLVINGELLKSVSKAIETITKQVF